MNLSIIATSSFLLIAGALLTKRKDLLLQKLSPRRNLVVSIKREKNQPHQQGLLELPDFVSILWFLDELRELSTKLAVSLANGTPLADQLAEFAASANANIRSQFLERAGKNETKMMIPLIFIILPVTVMFALYPSVTMLRNSFI